MECDSDEWAETVACSAMAMGEAFGRRLVFSGVHFWRLCVKDPMGGYEGRGVSVGFVSERDQSVWLRCDGAVRINGEPRGSVAGLAMKNGDTLRVCLDLENGALFVQRIESKGGRRVKVHKVTRVPLRGVQLNNGEAREGWRIGSVLRLRNQMVAIKAYSNEPFDEWQWPRI